MKALEVQRLADPRGGDPAPYREALLLVPRGRGAEGLESRATMQVRLENQLNPVADEVLALTAVVRPILVGTLFALRREVVQEVGGFDRVSLRLLSRLYIPGDGDCGLCFEYAVHDALRRQDPLVAERVEEALGHARIYGRPESILFGAEKIGSQQLIDTAAELLTDESVLMYGTAGRPLKLKRHISLVAAAFRRPEVRLALPQSISGLWKADLFVGDARSDRWVGTSVKVNRQHLEPAKGLRIGIIPSRGGARDPIVRDEQRNLILCPLPHDESFMQIFYEGFAIVQSFIRAHAAMPGEVALPRPAMRQVARELAQRREFPVLAVVDALEALAQPELLATDARNAVVQTPANQIATGAVLAPVPRSQ